MDLKKKSKQTAYVAACCLSFSICVGSIGYTIPSIVLASTPDVALAAEEGDTNTDVNNTAADIYNKLESKYLNLQSEYEDLEKDYINLVKDYEAVYNELEELKESQKSDEKVTTEKSSDNKKETKETSDTTEPAVENNTTEQTEENTTVDNKTACLNAYDGVFYGPSGKETYYNLPMEGVVSHMRGRGFSEEEYPYWVREDGCKMLGDYIMVAANLGVHPRGSIVETSLGMGLVCDTGDFAKTNKHQLDIATTWEKP